MVDGNTMSTDLPISEFKAIVGDEHVLEPRQIADPLTVDGVSPRLSVAPGDTDQIQAVMAVCHQYSLAVLPVGGATQLNLGGVPIDALVAITTSRLNRMVEHAANDLVVIAEAGLTLSMLQSTLDQHQQYLPLDAPNPKRSTLGGIIATDASGPMRLGHGTVRDLLIGVRAVMADGTLIKGGGKVMKNVAGYDLCKLFTGQLGTLGIVVEVTLRTKPNPEQMAVGKSRLSSAEQGEQAVAALINDFGLPAFLDITDEDHQVLVVGYQGNRDEVEFMAEHFRRTANAHGLLDTEVLFDADAVELHRQLVDFPSRKSTLSFKATMQSSNVTRSLQEMRDRATSLGLKLSLLAHAGNGVVLGHLAGDNTEDTRRFVEETASACVSNEGTLVITKAEIALKEMLPIWGPGQPTWPLFREIKDKLDPKGILNPGRFVGGI